MSYLPKERKVKVKWPVTILYDDREKLPWLIKDIRFKYLRKRLEVGDYTFENWEGIIAIEKKGSWDEFLSNISGRNRAWFKSVLHKLKKCKYPMIVIEDDFANLPKALRRLSGTKLTTDSVYYWITKIMVEYNIPVLLIGRKRSVRNGVLLRLFEALAMKIARSK